MVYGVPGGRGVKPDSTTWWFLQCFYSRSPRSLASL